jgi:hypothetical protein
MSSSEKWEAMIKDLRQDADRVIALTTKQARKDPSERTLRHLYVFRFRQVTMS